MMKTLFNFKPKTNIIKMHEMKEFMNLMIRFWENNVKKIFTKQRDLDIANAVIELFRSSDRIDAFQ